MTAYINNFLKYRKLLFTLTKKEIYLRYRRSYLGLLWSLLNPLMTMIVLTIVFSALFARDIPNFPVYLLTGKVIFDFNAQTTNAAMSSIVNHQALMKKVYIPKYIFPLAETLSSFVNLFFSIIALVLVMVFTRSTFYPALLLSWIPLLYLFVFSTGLGLFLSAFNVFFRDITHLYGVILTAWTYFTPLFYPVEIIPDHFYIILKWNPLFHMIKMFRMMVMDGTLPALYQHVICLSAAIGALAIGLAVFFKTQDRFILYI